MIHYIYDFLSIVFDKLKDNEKIRNIILFGSTARNEQRKDSDIDLFIDIPEENKTKVDEIIKSALDEFELKSQKSWHLKGIKNQIVPIVDDINKEKWKELKSEIENYGKLLYGDLIPIKKKDKPCLLVEYNLSNLKQKDKMRILRALYGYKAKQNKKIYVQEGLFQKENAEKISNGIIISLNSQKRIIDFLKNNKVQIKIKRIWI